MCGIGIIHHQDSEFHSSQFQFNSKRFWLRFHHWHLPKTIPIPTLTGVRVRIVLWFRLESMNHPRSESFSCHNNVGLYIKTFLKSDQHNSVVYFYVKNFDWFSGYKKLLGNWNVLLIVLNYILKVLLDKLNSQREIRHHRVSPFILILHTAICLLVII